MKKYIIGAIMLVLGAIGYGINSQPQNLQGVSPVGTLQSNAQLAQISISPSATTGTSTSILNSSYDRAITEAFAFCTGMTKPDTTLAGQSTLNVTAATTTSLTTAGSNSVYSVNLGIGTTTSTVYAASTTFGNDTLRVWPASTYLQFFFQATSTAACTIGVKYIAL